MMFLPKTIIPIEAIQHIVESAYNHKIHPGRTTPNPEMRYIVSKLAMMYGKYRICYVARYFKCTHGTLSKGMKELQWRADTDKTFRVRFEAIALVVKQW